MQNKHKLWIFVGVIFLFAVAIVGFASTQVPSLVITDPNSTSNSSSSVSHSTSNSKSSGNLNPQQTTPPTQMKQCPKCVGTGEITCTKCNGVFQWKECPNCHKIVPITSSATACGCTWGTLGHGTNFVVKKCDCGDGKVTCPMCNGAKQVPA